MKITMQQAVIKKIFLTVFVFGLFTLGGIFIAEAQTGNCQVTNAQFRVTRLPFNASTFYDEDNVPYIYIDIETVNCIASDVIEVSIFEEDPAIDYYVNGNLGLAEDCSPTNDSCMKERPIPFNTVPGNNFTLSMLAGEDKCDGTTPSCQYKIETFSDVGGSIDWPSALNYDCDSFCEQNWKYLGPLSIFEGTHEDDLDDDPIDTSPVTDDDTSPVTDDDTSPVSDPEGSSGGGPIDLNLTNPLAGTVDTIPQFFQKILDIIIKIAIPIVAIAIVYSGLLFVTARGNEEQLKRAKNAFAFAVIGGLILLASWLVAQAIKDALTSLAYVL